VSHEKKARSIDISLKAHSVCDESNFRNGEAAREAGGGYR
jgi:hypothetical protein